ncbi:MAG TPA: DUF4380 domain-containing protein [Candidatus Saccharimonadales bacterium]|nr:DUF4380 domain-containing protein [Candidatus Saccharimonadales bacterium]
MRCSSSARAGDSNYHGWKSLKLSNDLIEVQVVPDIGRVIQLKLADFEYLWTNAQLAGHVPPISGVGPNNSWLNYGGSKLWPAPQGWGRDDYWPGPPDPVLDGSPHTGSILEQNGESAVQLVSQKDKRSGVQFTRKIKIYENVTRVSIDCRMENIDTRARRWGIWQVTQHNTAKRDSPGFDKNTRVYCPINPNSIYPNGYKVIYGRSDNPEYSIENGMVCVQYLHLVGKIGMDCSAGWYAVVNRTSGHVFVERFNWIPETEYPDGASFEAWTQGAGTIQAYGREVEMSERVEENPYVLETEVLSPFAQLQPGASSCYHSDWYVTRVQANLSVIRCNNLGVTCEPLRANLSGDKLTIRGGHFGIFSRGEVALAFADARGEKISVGESRAPISPTKPLGLDELRNLADRTTIPSQADQLSLVLLDDSGTSIGCLGATKIEK